MSQTGNENKWVLFPYNPNHEKSIKLDFSGKVPLTNGKQGSILGVKGTSKDGNTKFVRVFAQVGVLFKDTEKENQFTGSINYSEVGGEKSLLGFLNDKSETPNLSGYLNEPSKKGKQNNLKF